MFMLYEIDLLEDLIFVEQVYANDTFLTYMNSISTFGNRVLLRRL